MGRLSAIDRARVAAYEAKARRDTIEAELKERNSLPVAEVEAAWVQVARAVNKVLERPEFSAAQRQELAEVMQGELAKLIGDESA